MDHILYINGVGVKMDVIIALDHILFINGVGVKMDVTIAFLFFKWYHSAWWNLCLKRSPVNSIETNVHACVNKRLFNSAYITRETKIQKRTQIFQHITSTKNALEFKN